MKKQFPLKRLMQLLLGLLLHFGALQAFACITPPSNDHCSSATAVSINPSGSCGSSYTGDTRCSTPDVPAPSTYMDMSHGSADVWYSFVPSSSMVAYTVDSISATKLYYVLYDSCGAGASAVSEGFILFGRAQTFAYLSPGHTYYLGILADSLLSTGGEFNLCMRDTSFTPCALDLGADLVSCYGPSEVYWSLAGGSGLYSYYWSDRSGLAIDDMGHTTFTGAASHSYILLATDIINGCTALDTIVVTGMDTTTVNETVQICDAPYMYIGAVTSDAIRTWVSYSDGHGIDTSLGGTHTPSYMATASGTYTFVDSLPGCGSTRTYNYHADIEYYTPAFSPTSYTICPGDTVYPDLGIGAATYMWMSGGFVVSVDPILMVTAPGFYFGVATDFCGNTHPYGYTVTWNPSCMPGGCGIDAGPDIFNCGVPSTTLTVAIPGDTSAGYVVTWTPNTGIISTSARGNIVVFDGAENITYRCGVYYFSSGCFSEDTITVTSIDTIANYNITTCAPDTMLDMVGIGHWVSFTDVGGTVTPLTDRSRYYLASASGVYEAYETGVCGLVHKFFNVTLLPHYTDLLGGVFTTRYVCAGDSLLLDAGPGGMIYDYSIAGGASHVSTTEFYWAHAGEYVNCTVFDTCGTSYNHFIDVQRDTLCAPDSVWPGDCNYDGRADLYDFLSIGMAMGDVGPVRSDLGIGWYAHSSTDWLHTFYSGLNHKHADADGNGVVDFSDVLAIYTNYGLVHARLSGEGSRSDDPTIPNLTLRANFDTCGLNTRVNIDVLLGDASTPIDSLYGIVLKFNLDKSLVDTNSINVNYTGSWLGTDGTNLMSFRKNLYFTDRMDLGATRYDGNNITGFGKLTTISIVTVDNLTNMTAMPLTITDYYATTRSGDTVRFDIINDTVFIDPARKTGIDDPNSMEEKVSLFPSPADHEITISSELNSDAHAEVVSMIGQVVSSFEMKAGAEQKLNVQKWESGMYYLQLSNASGTLRKKFEVMH
jgi:Secretion system C-terminal sorting domain